MLVNTVGPAHVGGLDDLTDAAWLDEFDLGVLTMVRTTRAALPLLRQATFARVVNVAASSIRHQSPGLIGFTAAKAAMASASKNLSRALAPEGIIVNTVAPGTVMSPTLASYLVGTDLEGLPEGPLEAAYEAIARDYGASNDIGRVGLPEEVATMVVFLCSELCSFVVGATVPSTAAPTSSDAIFWRTARGAGRVEFNLADLWERVVDEIPDHEALVCGDRRLTYARGRRARRPGSPTTSPALGVGAGDHVALYLYNGTEYLEGMLAAFKLRAVPVNVNYRYGEDELRYLLDDADAQGGRVPPRVRTGARRDPRRPAAAPGLRRGRRRLGRAVAARGDGVRGGTRRRVRRARLRSPLGRRPLHPLHGRHHRDAQGCDVAREDIFFGAFGGGNLGDAPITSPEQVVDSLRPAPARRCPRARSCTAPRTGWRSARSTPAARSSSRPSVTSTPSTCGG